MLVTCCLIEVEKIIYTSADNEVFDKVTQKIMDKKTVQSSQLHVWRLSSHNINYYDILLIQTSSLSNTVM